MRALETVLRSFARGVAVFFGAFSLVNFAGQVAGSRLGADLWWIDLRMLPGRSGAAFGVLAAFLLVWYGIDPAVRTSWRRVATTLAASALTAASVFNASGFYGAWRAGLIEPGLRFPLSLPMAALFAGVGWAAWTTTATPRRPAGELVGAVAVALSLAIAFPLAQVAFFGTTDYRRPADVAVVLGAKVHADGRLSSSLEDRVQTGVSLYHEGLVRRLIMSGGVGESGIDEAVAMRERAVELGVPTTAVDVDGAGVNTDATVANTVRMVDDTDRILVVSQFYHLPRIKLAYRAAGRDVYTVPAAERRIIAKTPLFVAREVPGFWVYWSRALARDLLDG